MEHPLTTVLQRLKREQETRQRMITWSQREKFFVAVGEKENVSRLYESAKERTFCNA